MGKEDYDIAWWAQRLRIAQRVLPQLLGLLGLNAAAISKNVSGSHPMIAAVLAGGKYPSLDTGVDILTGAAVSTFASWEIFAAKALYWYIVPAFQFGLAVFILDTWQYFLHRAMHMNKWLYSEFQLTPVLTRPNSNNYSNIPLPSPPSLRPIRIRRTLQPPSRRVSPRHPRSKYCVQSGRHDNTPRNGVLRRLHNQDRRRPLRLLAALGSAPAHHKQQCRVPRHPPPKLGHQDEFLAAILYILGSLTRHSLERRHIRTLRKI